MDHLLLGPCLLDKAGQRALHDDVDWRREYQLDHSRATRRRRVLDGQETDRAGRRSLPGWLRGLRDRVVLVCLGIVLGIVALEACLQLMAAYRSATRRGDVVSPFAASRRIVCLGDSNTYGVYVRRENSYPRVLERVWNADPTAPRVQVMNLGYPGNNTSVLRNRFLDVLNEYQPDVILLQIGVNDFWTVPEPIKDGSTGLPGLRQWLWRHFRVYRLLYMMERAWGPPPPEHMPGVADAGRWAPANDPIVGFDDAMRANIAFMVASARTAGVEPILLTYASSWNVYGPANVEIRRVAAATHAELIDVAPVFDPQCPDGVCPLFLKDLHPSADGYRLVAETIVAELRRRNLVVARH